VHDTVRLEARFLLSGGTQILFFGGGNLTTTFLTVDMAAPTFFFVYRNQKFLESSREGGCTPVLNMRELFSATLTHLPLRYTCLTSGASCGGVVVVISVSFFYVF
jgi:hypothetical protein